eukprot:TRINITY_DN4212_c0_g1_i1.p1 TRINITY_DN4212_c0_g1~~TRINITY_DN4212_c0_g1_i1.p1  ORF type:complete len:517 (+),score=123.25 TRINITY_DN4212_c0_g1_i1:59-1552(+)
MISLPLLAVTLLVVATALYLRFADRRRSGEAPLIGGSVPYLGAAIAFGKDPRGLLTGAQKKYGDVFTVLLAGTRFTFLVNPKDQQLVCKDEDLFDSETGQFNFFRAFVPNKPQSFINKYAPFSFSIPRENPTIGGHLRQGLMQKEHLNNIAGVATGVLANVLKKVLSGGPVKTTLRDFVSQVLVTTTTKTMFGTTPTVNEVWKHYVEYEKKISMSFRGVPNSFIPGYLEAMQEMIKVYPKTSLPDDASWMMKARLEVFKDAAPEVRELIYYLNNAFMFAFNGNTVAAVCWIIYYVVIDPSLRTRVLAEFDAVIETNDLKPVDGLYSLPMEEDVSTPVLDAVFYETLRLHSTAGVFRIAQRDTQVAFKSGTYNIRKGDTILIGPTASYDPDLFPNPSQFNLDRFLVGEDGKMPVLTKGGEKVPRAHLVSFGAGKHLCPGRFFALRETKALLFSLLKNVEMDFDALNPNMQPDNGMFLLATLPPLDDMRCTLSLRDQAE